MTFTEVFFALVVVIFPTGVALAQGKPDFSGTWTNAAGDRLNNTEMRVITGVRSMGCDEFRISQDERVLRITVRTPGDAQPTEWTHPFDGSEHLDVIKLGEITSRLVWQGSEAVLTMANRKMLAELDIKQVIRLDPDGRLAVTTSSEVAPHLAAAAASRVRLAPPVTRYYEKLDHQKCREVQFQRFREKQSR
jgi:hypothetical protein